jgi:hypothetical protein
MSTIRPSMPTIRVAPARPVSAAAPAPAAEPVAKPVVQPKPEAKNWGAKRVLATVGIGAAGFVGGSVGTMVTDLLFHFGNNGGVAWPGGVYIAAGGLLAAGGIALYNHFRK